MPPKNGAFTRKRSQHVLTPLFATCLLSFTTIMAQADAGKISINVVDAHSRRPIDNAKVSLIDRAGESQQFQTNAQGQLVLDTLESGLYAIDIQHPNYIRAQATSIRVVDNKTFPLNVELNFAGNDLEELLVIGNIVAVDRLASVGSTYIDREALRSAAGSGSDVLRALDGLPGLFSSGEFASFTVRGNGPKDNLILVDGIPFENVVHFGDSFGEIDDIEGGGRYSVFAPNLIQGAEFQPGGWNAAYGGKSGSLLKLDVAEGNPESASYTTRLDFAGLEIGYDGPSGIHDDTSVLFSARDLDFGRLFESIGIDDIGTPTLTDIILKTTSQINAANTLNALVIYAPEDYVRDIDNVLASDEDEPGNYEDVSLAHSDVDNALYALTWSHLIGSDTEIINQVYYRHYDERNITGEAYPTLVPQGTAPEDIPIREQILQSSRGETELGWRFDLHSANAIGLYSAGVRLTQLDLDFALALDGDWIRYVYDESDPRPTEDTRYIVLTPESINSEYSDSSTNATLYGDQTVAFGDSEMRLGLRYDYDGFAEEHLFSPRFGYQWQFSSASTVSATAGRYYQSPGYSDRAIDPQNNALENEIIDQLSIGFRTRLAADLEFMIEPYYQRLDHLVIEQDGVEQQYNNAGEGYSYGIDSAITRRFGNGWSANMNYSYNHARVKDNPSDAYYDADFSRPHALSIGGLWEINTHWKISARWKWASGATRDGFIIYDNVLGDGEPLRFSKEITETNIDRYKQYHSLNFRVDYRRAFGKVNFIAFFDVINAYGADNPSSSDFNERTGEEAVEEGDSFPLVGLRLEW